MEKRMSYALTWLPDVLRSAGLEVLEYPGWQNAGHGNVGQIKGILCHHTCGPLHGDLPDINVLVKGRSDLAGPLCNLGLGRSGKFYIIAAGRGYHAGKGNWQGVTDGNSSFIGIEAENTGESTGPRADVWPAVQLDSYKRGCAAILKHIGAKPIMVAGHKEYALPKGRKDDPNFDMEAFRAEVAKIMGETAAPVIVNRKGRINTNDLNVRSMAAASSRIVDMLDKGAVVDVLGESMNGSTRWYRIGEGRFVASRYVDLTA
jgi:hypothetical protein